MTRSVWVSTCLFMRNAGRDSTPSVTAGDAAFYVNFQWAMKAAHEDTATDVLIDQILERIYGPPLIG